MTKKDVECFKYAVGEKESEEDENLEFQKSGRQERIAFFSKPLLALRLVGVAVLTARCAVV